MILTIFIVVIVGILLNAISKKYVLENVTYRRGFSKKVIEIKEEFTIDITVENKKMLPVTFLQIDEEYPGVLDYVNRASTTKNVETKLHTINMVLLPYQRIKRKYKVNASRRGRYLSKDVKLIAGDILGLKNFEKEIQFMHEFVVLPEKIELEEELTPYGDFNGDFSVRRWIIEDPILTVGIREYTGNEPQKTIHWPSSLKGMGLMVKKFDYTTDNRVMLVLNVETNKPFWANIEYLPIEKCISYSRSIIEELEEMGIPYGFVSNGQVMGEMDDGLILPGWGQVQLDTILERLGRIDYAINAQFEDLIIDLINKNIRYGTYIMVLPYLLNEYIEYINILSNQCDKFILITLSDRYMDLINNKVIKYIKRGE